MIKINESFLFLIVQRPTTPLANFYYVQYGKFVGILSARYPYSTRYYISVLV
jgi:hypothetical protein